MGLKRLMLAVLLISAGNMAFADNGTEFGVEDDFTVWGTSGTWPDADVEIKGYSIFGSTNIQPVVVTSGPGNVAINGRLEVSSSAYIWGNLGLSTGAPQGRLDVNGNMMVRSSVTINSGNAISLIVSSNVVLQGTTFYAGGNATLGLSESTVTVSGALKLSDGTVLYSTSVFAPYQGVAFLNSTQTYTGANTFASSVTIVNTFSNDAYSLAVGTSTAYSFVVSTAGNVGVGTLAVSGARLAVSGSTETAYVITAGTGAAYDFVVSTGGNVGIGTTSPSAKLEVKDGAIKASDGFIMETRTNDPTSPVTGRMWLRTDLQ